MDESFAKLISSPDQNCPLKKAWVSFRLVDEFGQGEPYANLSYSLIDSQGSEHTGTLDERGYAKVEPIYCGPSILRFHEKYKGNIDVWYDDLTHRQGFALPITQLQAVAEQTQRRNSNQLSSNPKLAAKENAEFYRVEVRDLVEFTSHLPPASKILAPRPSIRLASNSNQHDGKSFGIGLAPNKHHLLEIKALTAWRPLLSLTSEFSALDAYQLSLLTTLAYSDFGEKYAEGQDTPPIYPFPGSIGYILNSRLAHIETGALNEEPARFKDVTPYHLILEEVPYSKRLEIIPFDPLYYTKENEQKKPWQLHSLNDTNTNTQAYISHDDRMILIGIRGTQEWPDFARDIDAKQVPYEEGIGQAHRGFYKAFLAVKEFVKPYLFNFYSGQKIVVNGHSLGGAIALLLAEWLRREERNYDVLLYTYGAPRAGDRKFVEGASELIHHRLVNHNDPIPSLPATWMDTDQRIFIPGIAALITGATGIGGAAFLAGIVNLKGDNYQHHGTLHHFLPLPIGRGETTSVLWQPECSGIEEAACTYYAANIKNDMPDRALFIAQLASMSQHFTVAGYVPACHATLLRWKASAAQGGQSLTKREQEWLEKEIYSYQKNLELWEKQAWQKYDALHRHQEVSLSLRRQQFEQAISFAAAERRRLPRTLGRIRELAQKPISLENVYGSQINNPILSSLISRWQQHDENLPSKTPQLASIPRPYKLSYV
ncbi:lipase [Pseudomonas asuensis]|uniref:Lipase n=1 Tax=Pseudomonas asuensis TaxID=1825787 RepID=A0ABQ2GYP6_9PSED|nr:lipase family protein [Pseudomonas asuensis]GGM20489.1 lipase [Pseudomonas asuensis]